MWKRFSIIGRERHGGEEKSYVQGVHYPVGFERYKRDLDTGKSASSSVQGISEVLACKA